MKSSSLLRKRIELRLPFSFLRDRCLQHLFFSYNSRSKDESSISAENLYYER